MPQWRGRSSQEGQLKDVNNANISEKPGILLSRCDEPYPPNGKTLGKRKRKLTSLLYHRNDGMWNDCILLLKRTWNVLLKGNARRPNRVLHNLGRLTSVWFSSIYSNSTTEHRHPSWHSDVITPGVGYIPEDPGRMMGELANWKVFPPAPTVRVLS